jgi:hypothetical protein
MTEYDLGFPYGVFADRFFRLTHVPMARPCSSRKISGGERSNSSYGTCSFVSRATKMTTGTRGLFHE